MIKTDNSERKKTIANSLIEFSKHLMMILVAVIAFAAAPALDGTAPFIKYIFVAGILIAIISFIMGHEGILKIIDSYLRHDKDGNFIDDTEILKIGTIKDAKKNIEWQYWLVLLSLILISFAIIFSVLCEKNINAGNIKTINEKTIPDALQKHK